MDNNNNNNNKEYLSKHLITYLGNKRKLIYHIEKAILSIQSQLNKKTLTALDGFSGSGVVSRMLKYHCHSLHVNDMEPYSFIINQCYLSNPILEKRMKINQYIHELNQIDFNIEGPICKEYSPKETYNIQENERAFYTRENALIIDSIRSKINEYPSDYYPFLIAPLHVKASINTNTSGLFK